MSVEEAYTLARYMDDIINQLAHDEVTLDSLEELLASVGCRSGRV